MARKDLQYGQRAIARILKRLEYPAELEHRYAELILEQAVKNAAGKPTPQARMAADNMTVSGANIYPLRGGDPADVAVGSEFGSHVYAQFHRPPNPRGYWLYPAAEDDSVLRQMDDELEKMMQREIRSA